jgi:hypothetical protein
MGGPFPELVRVLRLSEARSVLAHFLQFGAQVLLLDDCPLERLLALADLAVDLRRLFFDLVLIGGTACGIDASRLDADRPQ